LKEWQAAIESTNQDGLLLEPIATGRNGVGPKKPAIAGFDAALTGHVSVDDNSPILD
jgi:hypothetical protein